MSVRYVVVVAKKDERVDGPDDAEIVITVPLVDAAADDFDPAVAFMRGKLKAVGRTGPDPRSAEVGRRRHGPRRARRCRVTVGSSADSHPFGAVTPAGQRGAL